MAKNSVEVRILGQYYKIGGDEPVNDIIRIAQTVDRDVKWTMDKNSGASPAMAAVLVAMEYLREIELQRDAHKAESEKDVEALQKLSKLEEELLAAKKTIREQNAQIIVLKDKLSRAKKSDKRK